MTTNLTGNPAQIIRLVRRNLLLLAAIALAVFAAVPSGRADSSAKLEKHARKIEKHLARYHTGTFVQIDIRDSGEAIGSLGNLSDGTFQIVSSDSNKLLTFRYSDVAGVKRAKEYIGAGSEPGHHFRRWVPLVAGALVAGGGVAAYETMR